MPVPAGTEIARPCTGTLLALARRLLRPRLACFLRWCTMALCISCSHMAAGTPLASARFHANGALARRLLVRDFMPSPPWHGGAGERETAQAAARKALTLYVHRANLECAYHAAPVTCGPNGRMPKRSGGGRPVGRRPNALRVEGCEMIECAIERRVDDAGIVTPTGLVHCDLDDDVAAVRELVRRLADDVVRCFAAVHRMARELRATQTER